MESNFNNRDFEQFVKQSADQYRMFPSEKVWKNINTALHGRRRWYYGLGLGLLLLTSGAVTWVMLSSDRSSAPVTAGLRLPAASETSIAKNPESQPDLLRPSVPNNRSSLPFAIQENLASPVQPVSSTEGPTGPVTASTRPEFEFRPLVVEHRPVVSAPRSVATSRALPKLNTETELLTTAVNEAPPESTKTEEVQRTQSEEIYPLSIESVLNTYQRSRKRLSWQAYFTPNISYRRLSENKDFLQTMRNQNTAPGYLYIPDINSAVKHKPDIGLNFGVTAGYALSKRLKLTAGLQFNISKYDIQASYSYQPEQATIALNTGFSGNNTLTTNTVYRNYNGYKENWLRNLYVSASLPIGAEFVVKGTHAKPVFGVAGTLQPIYILDNNAYLISTDYKNYVVIPSLIRQWNIGTSVEAFAGYSTGKLNWRVGPQVRYHIGSSFQRSYPVKEQLFDFGLKVGIMLNQ